MSVEDEHSEDRPTRRRVWDPVVRLTHWLMAISVTTGYLIGENMSFANIDWHFYFGYATGGLIVLRLLWGLVGPPPARIASLFFRPRRILSYAATVAERRPSYWLGHNPLGALSAIALWAALIATVATGLMSESDSFFAGGPLSDAVDAETRRTMTAWHHRLHLVLAPLVALHLAAVAFYYLWKRENLVRPMITGWKWVRRR